MKTLKDFNMNVNKLLLICILFIVSASLITNVSAAPTTSTDLDNTTSNTETFSPEVAPEEAGSSDTTEQVTGKFYSTMESYLSDCEWERITKRYKFIRILQKKEDGRSGIFSAQYMDFSSRTA